ncbi:MAG: hypothetical protein KDI42_01365 [Gammaproteobacteria bacterium]|nr:hypothetical protein [Gammaproteobacteria bacterium]
MALDPDIEMGPIRNGQPAMEALRVAIRISQLNDGFLGFGHGWQGGVMKERIMLARAENRGSDHALFGGHGWFSSPQKSSPLREATMVYIDRGQNHDDLARPTLALSNKSIEAAIRKSALNRILIYQYNPRPLNQPRLLPHRMAHSPHSDTCS